ncbi:MULTISPECIES: peroxidase [unclassified Novosphingobium]|uniref:Dyp-type peroxidase n=1 Tax=unclassified Novosphingobium TaxID=2644732 RepID=UPI00135AEF5A|nr:MULTISPECIES: peroxidase [unclassified Novosphingobium]
MSAAATETGDIQAIVDRGFGSLRAARYLLLRVIDPAAARAWLRSLTVTSLAEAKSHRVSCVDQIAFTAAGLRALGFAPDDIPGFAPEFLDGMAGDERRSHRLGDAGENAPQYWNWGAGAKEPHVLLILLSTEEAIATREAQIVNALPSAGCTLLALNRSNAHVGHEPFGFADGVSQPVLDWEGTLRPGGVRDRVYRNRLAMGEVLLGYPNEYGFVADHPTKAGVGRNGSYLVYRQLEQDVRGFWQWLAQVAGPGGAGDLAARMVGRTMDGAPLDDLPVTPVEGTQDRDNSFTFAADPDGIACPIGAHIRRANPRSSDDPQGRRGFVRDLLSSLGLKGTAIHDAVAAARFHRIVRRGRPYGPAISPAEAITAAEGAPLLPSGIHFICLNANLARQFEFVQGAWIASPSFAGLSGESDPLLGHRGPADGSLATDAFSHVDRHGCPRLLGGVPRFVTVKGGAYFFLPGLKGLAAILSG